MKRIKLLIIIIWLCFDIFQIKAQGLKAAIDIGQKVPDIKFEKVLNYKYTSAKISDFRGKLLIIDFWATWCGPCVEFLSRADSLQRIFGDNLQILPVTKESEIIVKQFLEKIKRFRGILPPSVVENSDLDKMFPHTYIPHEVWIDRDGKVIAITSYDQITEENIRNAINGSLGNLPIKFDEKQPESSSAVKNNQADRSKTIFSSYLGKYEIGKVSGAKSGKNSFDLEFTNSDVISLCEYAFGEFKRGFNRSRISNESKKTMLSLPEKGTEEELIDWNRENSFCYRLSVDSMFVGLPFKIAQEEINSFIKAKFKVECVVEKRNVKYYALIRTSNQDKLATHFPTEKEKIGYDKRFTMSLKNSPYWNFILPIQGYNLQLERVVDETGFDLKKKIDINLDCELSNIEDLNKALAKYDLQFVKREGPLDMIIIRDIQKQPSK